MGDGLTQTVMIFVTFGIDFQHAVLA
jgi:hypothetical protein